ncbi:hypothetical protein [Bradyrhizobium sp.]|uniref:hypothetical protein n=1 Tax=Bradyrhizobium sp. TaxID=376 RepID=UPI0027326653|nr:hypothetical protein [Bradyrhizobium sp.]MDP3075890.1 hypothetical protein [Bradyrhizobium sp.]
MNIEVMRLVVGLIVLATHIVAFFGIVVWQSGYIPVATERLDLALLLVPVSAGFFLAVVRSAVQNRKAMIAAAEPVGVNYVAVVTTVALAFSGALLFFVFSYPAVVGPTTVELRRWLVILEIGFGAGFGMIAEDLFGKVEKVFVQPDGTVKVGKADD